MYPENFYLALIQSLKSSMQLARNFWIHRNNESGSSRKGFLIGKEKQNSGRGRYLDLDLPRKPRYNTYIDFRGKPESFFIPVSGLNTSILGALNLMPCCLQPGTCHSANNSLVTCNTCNTCNICNICNTCPITAPFHMLLTGPEIKEPHDQEKGVLKHG